MELKYAAKDVTFLEVPNEISLTYSLTGCPLKCKGCHSPFLRNTKLGFTLDSEVLEKDIKDHLPFITCVCFLGGDWDTPNLIKLLSFTRKTFPFLKICLYSGYTDVPSDVVQYLDYLKVGEFIEEFGGLTSPETNQRFYKVPSYEDITSYFHTSSTE